MGFPLATSSRTQIVGGVCLLAVTLAIFGEVCLAGINPWIRTAVSEPCYSLDTPYSEICYPTRCYHLFNKTKDGELIPTPQKNYPQNYQKFTCNVSVWNEYPGYTARKCLRPLCVCKNRYKGGTCSPAKFMDCERHKCVQ